jgi:hypothetical protein
MTIIGLIFALVIIGVVLWLINTFIPMDPKVKTILNVVVIMLLALWLVQVLFGFSVLTRPIHIR